MKDLLTNILAGVSAVLAILLSFNILPIDMVNVLSEAIPQILLGIFAIIGYFTGKTQELNGRHK